MYTGVFNSCLLNNYSSIIYFNCAMSNLTYNNSGHLTTIIISNRLFNA